MLNNSHMLLASVLFVLALAHQATFNELVNQATGGRYGACEKFSDLFDAE
jgi:hypothetical protein